MKIRIAFIPLLIIVFSACTPEPSPIEFGQDACTYCKMAIVDQRFGAELLTNKGKVFKYDAIECLVNARFKDKEFEENEVHSLLVIDFGNPGNLVNAEKCVYLHSKNLPSPMGMFLSAYLIPSKATDMLAQKGGDILEWNQMIDLVLKEEQ